MAIGPGEPLTALTALNLALVPAMSGTYALCNQQGAYVYFGESADIQERLTYHMNNVAGCPRRSGAVSFAYELYPTEPARVARQNQLIAAYATPCNQMFG